MMMMMCPATTSIDTDALSVSRAKGEAIFSPPDAIPLPRHLSIKQATCRVVMSKQHNSATLSCLLSLNKLTADVTDNIRHAECQILPGAQNAKSAVV